MRSKGGVQGIPPPLSPFPIFGGGANLNQKITALGEASGCDAALLTFDVTAEDSFNNLQTWMNEVCSPLDMWRMMVQCFGGMIMVLVL